MTPCCDNCRFMRLRRVNDGAEDREHCQRHAPRIVGEIVVRYVDQHGLDDALDLASNFPTTVGEDWCGEWEAIPPEKPEVAI